MKLNLDFEILLGVAMREGQYAALNCTPTPMRVVGMGADYVVNDGACGFAWVNVKPGTSKFARYLKTKGIARRDTYYGGVTIWVSQFNQSYEKKMSYARAFANVLNDNNINARAMGRLD